MVDNLPLSRMQTGPLTERARHAEIRENTTFTLWLNQLVVDFQPIWLKTFNYDRLLTK